MSSTVLEHTDSGEVTAYGRRLADVARRTAQVTFASTYELGVCFLRSEKNQQRNRQDHHPEHYAS